MDWCRRRGQKSEWDSLLIRLLWYLLVLTVLICLKNDRLEIPFVHIAQGETVDKLVGFWAIFRSGCKRRGKKNKTDSGSGRLKICTGKENEKDTNGGRCWRSSISIRWKDKKHSGVGAGRRERCLTIQEMKGYVRVVTPPVACVSLVFTQ